MLLEFGGDHCVELWLLHLIAFGYRFQIIPYLLLIAVLINK